MWIILLILLSEDKDLKINSVVIWEFGLYFKIIVL